MRWTYVEVHHHDQHFSFGEALEFSHLLHFRSFSCGNQQIIWFARKTSAGSPWVFNSCIHHTLVKRLNWQNGTIRNWSHSNNNNNNHLPALLCACFFFPLFFCCWLAFPPQMSPTIPIPQQKNPPVEVFWDWSPWTDVCWIPMTLWSSWVWKMKIVGSASSARRHKWPQRVLPLWCVVVTPYKLGVIQTTVEMPERSSVPWGMSQKYRLHEGPLLCEAVMVV